LFNVGGFFTLVTRKSIAASTQQHSKTQRDIELRAGFDRVTPERKSFHITHTKLLYKTEASVQNSPAPSCWPLNDAVSRTHVMPLGADNVIKYRLFALSLDDTVYQLHA
jgi:hypothetical protein